MLPVAAMAGEKIPELAVTPPWVQGGAEEGLRPALLLGAEAAGQFAAMPGEERLPAGEGLPACFDPRCGKRTAERTRTTHVLLSCLRNKGGAGELVLALYSARDGQVRALRRPILRPDTLVSTARAAAADLVEGRGEISGGQWTDIRWLSDRDSTDGRRFFRYGLLGALAGAGVLVLSQDQWRSDPVSQGPLSLGGDPASDISSQRGFFVDAPLDARAQGRGGAGASLSADALTVLVNPAALGMIDRANLVLARSQSPDGSPLLSAAYAAPTTGYWTQGLALHYAGDGLASEATVAWGWAYDLQGFEGRFRGILLGAAGKLYLAQVGEEGTGVDRSRGRSTGAGLDLGAVLPLEERLKASFALRDVPGFLWHRNDFTDVSQSEGLPPEFRAAAAGRASETLEFFLEGRRSLATDAPVHIHVGAEQEIFRVLSARTGYHQIFGAESVRRFSLGFGLDTRGYRPWPSLGAQFAFEYGLGDHEALVGSQQFSLEVRF